MHVHERGVGQCLGKLMAKKLGLWTMMALRHLPSTMHVHEGGDMQRLGDLMAERVKAECDCFTPGGVGHDCQACLEPPLSIVAVVHADGVLDIARCRWVCQHAHPACAQGL